MSQAENAVAAAYARKSSDNSPSLKVQLRTTVQAAQDDGFHVPNSENFRFGDNDVSGVRDKRPGFDALKSIVASDHTPFTHLYVRNAKRFGRWTDPRKRIYWHMWFEGHGVKVVYVKGTNVDVDDKIEPDDFGDLLVDFVESFQAAQERDEIRWRTSHGRRGWFINGFWPNGNQPYGTERWLASVEDGSFIQRVKKGERIRRPDCHFRLRWADDGSKETVARIFRAIDEEGASYREVARRLTSDDVPPPKGTAGDKWHPTTVRRIAKNPIYKGDAVWGRTTSGDEEPVPAEEATADPDEGGPILYRNFIPDPPVSRERFQSVQEVVKDRAENGKGRPPQARYLLSGLLRCAYCGASWGGHTSSKKENTRRTYYRHTHRVDCPDADRKYIRSSVMEDAVLRRLLVGLDQTDLNNRIRRELKKIQGDQKAKERRDQIDKLETGLKRDREALDRAQEEMLYADSSEATQSKKRVIDRIESRIEKRKSALRDLRQTQERISKLKQRHQKVTKLLTDKIALLRSASAERRKEVLQTLLARIEVDPNQRKLTLVSTQL